MEEVLVYGAGERCASCVNLPSSEETAEWLRAALERKYPDRKIAVRYIDIHSELSGTEAAFAAKVIDEDLFYPVVVARNEIVSEGNPKLKNLYSVLEDHSATA
ncbi:DUF1462 family protein [Guptibacillus hwajinpoensis]|uniref:Disulfide oxidoreductase YuzD n=1 Tax=Guptibacillus hwajinpoensis TaxID=208199 RepID=A0ABU0K4N6_9BACL|nr:DUF1462 family protein [Alkalihalobacillus hemicentroti]MDQ0484311.1 disulfide oxidoreductase YuzD [Alkalihalobacillus hemicentroti]